MYLNEIYFLVWTMIWYIWFWTIWLCLTLIPSQWGLFIGTLIPKPMKLFISTLIFSQWKLFIGILIPKPMGVIHWYSDTQPMRVIHWYFDTQPMEVIHWYSDTQTKGGYSLVLWYPNQWGLFISILIPRPMEVIHWYSDT